MSRKSVSHCIFSFIICLTSNSPFCFGSDEVENTNSYIGNVSSITCPTDEDASYKFWKDKSDIFKNFMPQNSDGSRWTEVSVYKMPRFYWDIGTARQMLRFYYFTRSKEYNASSPGILDLTFLSLGKELCGSDMNRKKIKKIIMADFGNFLSALVVNPQTGKAEFPIWSYEPLLEKPWLLPGERSESEVRPFSVRKIAEFYYDLFFGVNYWYQKKGYHNDYCVSYGSPCYDVFNGWGNYFGVVANP